ncbi:uncharacterized protein AC631_00260 [Debaryomyces fabryi]|uniref:MI domain-containing protein n=1 Tax=Debaryomyces fabryi TaxID=58627 RepID=A0A0V1Q6J4_9ASCO|nr:uncharacterized protein AC631_00260 [Debaryomyces fabryi]KSA03990.1 hypothetical protein AC631_00260 [Debaryomyces fabryi]CUM53778.1 unnamed protein product [Debaryomyces fabryi]
MAVNKSRGDDESREIRIPSLLLDQIKSKEDKGDYADDGSRYTKFDHKIDNKKRKEKPISRKEKRQEERRLKKQKKSKLTSNKKPSSKPKTEKVGMNQEDPLAALRALKEAKRAQRSHETKDLTIKILKEEDLEDDQLSEDNDDFGGFSDDENIDDFIDDSIDEDDFDEESFDESNASEEEDPLAKLKKLKEMKMAKANKTTEDPIAQLKAMKEKKDKAKKREDPIAQLKALKEEKKKKSSKDKESKKEKEVSSISPHDRELMKRDEDDMAFYAKKLGLKNGKNSKLPKLGEDDTIGGLLDGLDLDFMDDEGSFSDDDNQENSHSKKGPKLPFSSDDELSEGDFDDDDDDLDDDLDELSDYDDQKPRVKENPYVAPVDDNNKDYDTEDEGDGAPKKYIPPALRRKLALESSETSPEVMALRKSIKGPLNKLSEANISSIINEISSLYLSNPRHLVSENLTSIVLESILQQGRLLDTFVYLHATLVVAIYRLQGVEFGALFIQTLIEKFDNYYGQPTKGKEISNIVSLLSAVYTFQLVSSKLLYDIIKFLINDLNETNAELLLRIIRNSGNQMRTDDPTALKEIVLLTNKVSSSMLSEKLNTRTQFLLETIASLKNNKLKNTNEASHHLTITLKKFLGGVNNNKFNDPIQVTLEDIHNIDTRGKWWLVGSAWKGHDHIENKTESTFNEEAVNDILDNTEPNWMELARSQRMNTDIRRAIFISIMSANDYVDALTKLDKLALKRSQEREIPRVLIHCTGVEPAWNPYYGILASKLCDNHSNRKTFQFMLWDLIKDFEGSDGHGSDDEDEDFLGFDTSDEDDESRLKRISNLGRFFGYLLAEGSLPLHVLKSVNFLIASNDTVLFLELVLLVFLDHVGKKSQINSVGAGLTGSRTGKTMYEQKYDDKILIERLIKAQEQQTLLRGLQYFLQDKVKASDFISGKKQRKRIEWGVDAMCDIIDEFLKAGDDL